MKKNYEHKAIHLLINEQETATLNSYLQDGWLFVKAIVNEKQYGYVVILKREVK